MFAKKSEMKLFVATKTKLNKSSKPHTVVADDFDEMMLGVKNGQIVHISEIPDRVGDDDVIDSETVSKYSPLAWGYSRSSAARRFT